MLGFHLSSLKRSHWLLSSTYCSSLWFRLNTIIWQMLKNRVGTWLSSMMLISCVIHLSKLLLIHLLKFSLLLNILIILLLLLLHLHLLLIWWIQTSTWCRTKKQKWIGWKLLTYFYLLRLLTVLTILESANYSSSLLGSYCCY